MIIHSANVRMGSVLASGRKGECEMHAAQANEVQRLCLMRCGVSPCTKIVAAAFLLTLGGCRSASSYRAEADGIAERIIASAQSAAVGDTEPFTIRTPEHTLRERLITEQGLQIGSPVSMGSDRLDPIEHWPDETYLQEGRSQGSIAVDDADLSEAVRLSLVEALAVAARNSRGYQSQKEAVFIAALNLDLARDEFRPTFGGTVEGSAIADLSTDEETVGLGSTPELSFSQRLENGMTLAGSLGLDLVQLLNPDNESSIALFGDLSVTVPLLRGSGRHIVREPLTQAERDTIYAIYDFERFKRAFVVDVASDYLSVLQALDQVNNSAQNYRSLIASARRLRRLADEGRVSEVEVDQAVQNELQARDRWISAQQSYERSLDGFRITLGLPTDAAVELERDEIIRLGEAVRTALDIVAEPEGDSPGVPGEDGAALTWTGADAEVRLEPPGREGAGVYELPEEVAVRLALENRLDLRREAGEVFDAQRGVVVAADALRAELTFFGSAGLGERRAITAADQDDSFNLVLGDADLRGLLTLDLPFERTAERNVYRTSLINLERAVREYQALEDQIKLEIRDRLRTLLTSREGLRIQAAAVQLAERRVDSTRLFLEIGRAQTRDLLEAQDDLLEAQDALTAALVNYRIAELEIQRDTGLLDVDENALWTEFDPASLGTGQSRGNNEPAGTDGAHKQTISGVASEDNDEHA